MLFFKNIFGITKENKVDESLDTHIEYINTMIKPALLLSKSSVSTNSKIGGLPNLPSSIEWPVWQSVSLAFFCQVDLSEAPLEVGMYSLNSGSLFFFYHYEQETWGFDPKDKGSWKVI